MRSTSNRAFSVYCLKYNCKYVIIWIINISMQGAYNINLLLEGAITDEDLDGFSDELIERVKFLYEN